MVCRGVIFRIFRILHLLCLSLSLNVREVLKKLPMSMCVCVPKSKILCLQLLHFRFLWNFAVFSYYNMKLCILLSPAFFRRGTLFSALRGASFRIFSRYLVPLTPPTVFVRSFWNFTGALRMVCRYACGFFRILKLFFITFYTFWT